ncbi:hypothetical protein ABKN59_009382 [Abortiporus biennis]
MPPNPINNYEEFLKISRAKLGYELYGYWELLSADNAEQIIFEHWDTFCPIVFPNSNERLFPPRPTYWTNNDKALFTETFGRNGLKAPLCWYQAQTLGLSSRDDANIPLSKYFPPSSSPIFFGATLHGRICLPSGADSFKQDRFVDHKVTVKEYSGDHWFILSHAEQINRDLNA